MYKPNDLRAYLTAGHPFIAADPARLQVRVADGKVIAAYGQGLSFEYRYTLKLTMLDFAGDEDALFALIVAWLSRHQRERLTNQDLALDAIVFEVDDLGGGKIDIEISLPLTEIVVAAPAEGGGYDLAHRPDDPIELDLPQPSLLHEVYGNAELLVACVAHHPPAP